jgi:hypothetical protein
VTGAQPAPEAPDIQQTSPAVTNASEARREWSGRREMKPRVPISRSSSFIASARSRLEESLGAALHALRGLLRAAPTSYRPPGSRRIRRPTTSQTRTWQMPSVRTRSRATEFSQGRGPAVAVRLENQSPTFFR